MRTLDQMAAIGLRSVAAKCRECEAVFEVPLKAFDLPGETGIDAVARLRPIACPHCSASANIAVSQDFDASP